MLYLTEIELNKSNWTNLGVLQNLKVNENIITFLFNPPLKLSLYCILPRQAGKREFQKHNFDFYCVVP